MNFLEFEFRFYDPLICRFIQIDPLAEDYNYQSAYNFAENRVIDGNELEGLEWTRFENPNEKAINYVVNLKVLNSTTGLGMSDNKAKKAANAIKTQTEKSFGGKDIDGNTVSVEVNLEFVDKISKGDFYLEFVDEVGLDGVSKEDTPIDVRLAEGKVDEIGNSTSNRIQISKLTNSSMEEFGNTGAHELGHTAGLMHNNDSDNSKNVVNSMKTNNLMFVPQRSNAITPQQRSEIRKIVPRVRPASTLKAVGIKKLN